MAIMRVLELIGAGLLAVVFWASIRTLGRTVLRLGGWKAGDEASAEVALGLAGYALGAAALGFAGWLRWPLVAALAVVPGVTGLVLGWTRRTRAGLDAAVRPATADQRVTWLALAVVASLYVLLASAPAVHYDLMVNYLEVPKAYLVSGSVAPLASNVFSTLAFGLHSLIAFPLALSELVDRSPFLFGGAEVVGFTNLLAMGAAAAAAVRLGTRIADDPGSGGAGALAAVLLWACMPQNLLVAALELPDPFVTCLAVVMTASAVAAASDGGAGDALASGVACGLLIAAKPQAAAPCVVVAVWWLARLRRDRSAAAFFAGAFLAWLPTALRSWVWLGSPLYPVVGGGGRADAVGRVLAENAISPATGLGVLGGRVLDVVTLYPEVGLVPVGLLGLLLARPRSPLALAAGTVPVVALCVVSGSTHNVLRWLQAPMLLLLVLAGVSAASWGRRIPVVRAAPVVLAVASLVIGVRWVDATVGAWRGLRAPDETVRATVSAFDLRRQMAREAPAKVLWIGEVQGYWGARNGVFPTVRDGAYLGRILDSNEPAEALRDAGFSAVVRTRGREGMLEEQGFWQEVGPTSVVARQRLDRLLAGLDGREVTPEGAVYDLGLPGQ